MGFSSYIVSLSEDVIIESVGPKYLNTFYNGNAAIVKTVTEKLGHKNIDIKDIKFKYVAIGDGDLLASVGSAEFIFQVYNDSKELKYYVQLSSNAAGTHFRTGKSANANSYGQKLTDAGERATIQSLYGEVLTPEDTKEELFIENPELFDNWKETFIETPKEVNKIIQSDIKGFQVIHDARDSNEFTKVISQFVKLLGEPKDSWNPADIWVIPKGELGTVSKRLSSILESDIDTDTKIGMFNNEIYTLYIDKLLYPISLKQIKNGLNKTEMTNIPGKNAVKFYKYNIEKFTVNLSYDTLEIGGLIFGNIDTGNSVSMQVRGFPHQYGTAQTEITSDGSQSGGRIGKVSAKVIDTIMDGYGESRISSIKYFGTAKRGNYLSNVDRKMIKEWSNWYKEVKSDSAVTVEPKVKNIEKHLEEYVEKGRENVEVAARLVMKIAGLKQQYFFIKNKNKISDIMNKFIFGAKKVSKSGGFFIKIW